jgi:integrase
LEEIFATQIQTLATALRPATIGAYRCTVRHFLGYLHTSFPQVHRLSQLRREPHVRGWLLELAQRHPPLSSKARRDYLFELRRLLEDLAEDGHPIQPGLIRRQDFPPRPSFLPRALSPEDDRRLQEELGRCDDLPAQALLLTRATGIRIGECMDLAWQWIACVLSATSNGPCTFHSASSIPNASSRPMRTSGTSWLAS